MSDVSRRYGRIADGFTARLGGVRDDQWDAPTPCTEWSVRDLVVHVIGTHGSLVAMVTGTEPLTADPGAAHAFTGDGWTALHLGAGFGTPEVADLLLQHGAQVDAISRNAQRNQPLHAAVALSRNAETIRLLLAHGADPNAVQVGGFTPLFSAATANRRDLAELLIENGARADHRCDLEKTAADFARERGHGDLADWLDSQAA